MSLIVSKPLRFHSTTRPRVISNLSSRMMEIAVLAIWDVQCTHSEMSRASQIRLTCRWLIRCLIIALGLHRPTACGPWSLWGVYSDSRILRRTDKMLTVQGLCEPVFPIHWPRQFLHLQFVQNEESCPKRLLLAVGEWKPKKRPLQPVWAMQGSLWNRSTTRVR